MLQQKHGIVILLCCLAVFSTAASSGPAASSNDHFAYLPIAVANNQIVVGASSYMHSTDSTTLYNLGCTAGKGSTDGYVSLVILDFGQPAFDGASYGTYIFYSYAFRSTVDIQVAAQSYLSGFYACSPTYAALRLVVGTSNYGSGVSANHGRAWATMINSIYAWIMATPGLSGKLSVRGGNDMEPSWGSSTVTRAWVDGYASAYTKPSYLYNYGSCDGCSFKQCPYCSPNNGWTVEDVWYVSYGAAPAWPVPEIYLTSGVHADQWYRIALYGVSSHNILMQFIASLTQWQACLTNGPCSGVNNTPLQGWTQLFDTVNADHLTRQVTGFLTDIGW
jgi:hypothetical protein